MDSSTNFLDYSLYSGNLNSLPAKQSLYINTINQYSFCIAEKDQIFKQALLNSSVLLPDGIGVVWAARFLTGVKIKKIAGADIHQHYLNLLNEHGGKCFYLGASNQTLNLIKSKISRTYPNICVGSFSPPFKEKFSSAENSQMIDMVNAFAPDVLFIGMTAPKQEKWVFENKNLLNARVICTIGAVFDFYAGNVKRPGQIWINLGLEWFVRLLKEPRRLAKRYLYYGPVFIYLILSSKANRKS